MGDFNLDFIYHETNKHIRKLFEKFNLKMCVKTVNQAFDIKGTTDRGTCLDMCLTNDDDDEERLGIL